MVKSNRAGILFENHFTPRLKLLNLCENTFRRIFGFGGSKNFLSKVLWRLFESWLLLFDRFDLCNYWVSPAKNMVANRQLAEQPDNTMELRKAGFPIDFQFWFQVTCNEMY